MWRRWTCWLAAVLLISACSHGTLTRVVRTDGTIVVGKLTAARPDAVVLELSDGSSVTVPRSIIRTIESADAPTSAPTAVASNTGNNGAGTKPSNTPPPNALPKNTAPNPVNSGTTPTTTPPMAPNSATPAKIAREA